MNHTCQRRSAYLLVHALTLIPIAALLMLLLGKLTLDAIYLNRVAVEHARIADTSDALIAQLREDAAAATRAVWSDASLQIERFTPAGVHTAVYLFSAKRITRTSAGNSDRVWAAPRLQYAWHLEAGPHGCLLTIELSESPPPRKTSILPHRAAATVLLPQQEGER